MAQKYDLPPLPEIGRPETYYQQLVKQADEADDACARCAAKVGQYLSLAMNPETPWEEKTRYFDHVLRRHCKKPPHPDEKVLAYFKRLTELVQQTAGQIALKMASEQDDLFATRLSMGQSRDQIENEAELFFGKLLPDGHCPEWMNEQDWNNLRIIRDQWI